MRLLDWSYAQNWAQQMIENQIRLHPERSAELRMIRIAVYGPNVFHWACSPERDTLWRRRAVDSDEDEPLVR